MYSNNILINNDQINKILLKQSYSNNYLLSNKNIASLSKTDDSSHSLPIILNKITSITHFIANEKYNLQFFPSFKSTKNLCAQEQMIKNFHLLPNYMPNTYHSALNNSQIVDAEGKSICMTHLSNSVLSRSLSMTSAKKIEPITDVFSHGPIDIAHRNRKKRIHTIKQRSTNYINDEQTDATLCLIQQINTYFNQNLSLSQKQSNKLNQYFLPSEKKYVSSKRITEPNSNTTSISNVVSKPNLNNISSFEEVTDSIDISIELFDDQDYSSEIVVNKNNALLQFYDQIITNNIQTKTTDNITSNDNMSYKLLSILKKGDRRENPHIQVDNTNNEKGKSIESRDKIANYYCNLTEIDNKTVCNSFNPTTTQTEIHIKYKPSVTSILPEIQQELSTSVLVAYVPNETNLSKITCQQKSTSKKSIESTEIKKMITNKTKISQHQQSILRESSLMNCDSSIFESSTAMHNLLNKSTENQSILLLQSQSLGSFESAHRNKPLIEVNEFPYSSRRISRVNVYKTIHQRLRLVTLIDIDLTTLFRTVL